MTPATRAALVQHLAAALVADVRVAVTGASGVAPGGTARNARTVVGRLAPGHPVGLSSRESPSETSLLRNQNPARGARDD